MLKERYEELEKRYSRLTETWNSTDFSENCLEESRWRFTRESLESRNPVTREFDVWYFGWGLPFPQHFVDGLVAVQDDVKSILGDTLHYFVKPHNMGTELFRLKMPKDEISEENIREGRRTARRILSNTYPFEIEYEGIGIAPEGVLVAKGYDPSGTVDKLRMEFGLSMPYASKEQINWIHTPMGRILERVGRDAFEKLRVYATENSQRPLGSVIVSRIKLNHETQWYGERKELIEELYLNPRNIV